jgi:4-hydroxythreonine-4-phosphate dehydrogenase
MVSPCRLAVTLGDPRGIGPEVAVAAAAAVREGDPDLELVFFGPEGMTPPDYSSQQVEAWDGTESGAGTCAGRAIEAAVEWAQSRSETGLVTAPIHKPALKRAGWNVPGHTELLQTLTGSASVGMLMSAERTRLGGPLRVLLATTHMPLRQVPEALTAELLVRQARLLDDALREGWSLPSPRLAICAVNPHASDDGLFGDEETRVLGPAVEELRTGGVTVSDPLPADTVFTRALSGEFDAVVAPYHDVGMAAFKTASFGCGVNVTLGLPFPRTSPDHGTAFDLAGTGRADPSSMIEALRLAARLTRGQL